MEELQVKSGDLRNVRLADYLGKRSSAFPRGWSMRYIVLSANFLYVYVTPTDKKPRRVICVDDCVVEVKEFPKQPFTISVTTPKNKEYLFAAETPESAAKWVTSIRNAGYTNMYQRTKEAVKFLDRCKDMLAPFVVALHAVDTNNEGGDGEQTEQTGSPKTSPTTPKSATTTTTKTDPDMPPALLADQNSVSPDDIASAKASMTGADVIQALNELKDAQIVASTAGKTLREKLAALESEAITLRDESDRARKAAVEANALRARVDELTARNTELQVRSDALNRDLSVSLQAAAKSTRLATTGASAAALKEAKGAEEDLLRARVRELQAQMTREREELLVQVRDAQQQAAANAAAASAAAAAAAAAASVRSPAGSNNNNNNNKANNDLGVSPRPAASSSAATPATPAPTTDVSVLYEHEWLSYLNEAQRLEREGNYADAEQQYQQVLEAKQDRCGVESVAVSTACRDLGRVLALQRRFDKAEDQYSRAVRLCSKLLGESHPNTACALTDLAAVLREQAKFDDAEMYATRAVASLKAGVGPDDVSTATALYNLAGLAKRQNKYRAAEEAYGEALRIFRDKLGEGQGETADTLYQMGCLYRKRNETSKAGVFFQQAADSYAKTYGPNDKRVMEAAKRAKGMSEKSGAAGKN